jgi:hypothetical protein
MRQRQAPYPHEMLGSEGVRSIITAEINRVGHPGDPSQGVPPGIYDLADKRLAAMDSAGIDVQILPTLCRVRRIWSRSFRLSRPDKLMMLDECQIADALTDNETRAKCPKSRLRGSDRDYSG